MQDRHALRVAVVLVGLLALRFLIGCGAQPEALEIRSEQVASSSPRYFLPAPQRDTPASVYVGAGLDMPDKCDQLLVVDTPSGPQLSKVRATWLRNEAKRKAKQAKLRQLIAAVVDEMGGDEVAAEMIWRKALYESSGHPGNVHVHSPDVAANRSAASKGRRRATARWRRARVSVYRRHRGRLRKAGTADAWALGRGLYGMVTGLYAHWWHEDAPPWSLCDPVVATVVLVWSMRAGLEECHGSTLRDAFRRFSSGKCTVREGRLERRFDRLVSGKVRKARVSRWEIDPDAPADFGVRWPAETTDRRELLAAIHRRLERDGCAPTR